MEELSRKGYFNLKRQYEVYHFFLICCRVLFAFVMLYLIVVSSIYSINTNLDERIVSIAKNIGKISIPVIISFWVIFKVVCVFYLKRLRYMKRKLDILDEI